MEVRGGVGEGEEGKEGSEGRWPRADPVLSICSSIRMSLSTLDIRVDRLRSVSPVPTDLGTGTGAFLPGGIFHLSPGGTITWHILPPRRPNTDCFCGRAPPAGHFDSPGHSASCLTIIFSICPCQLILANNSMNAHLTMAKKFH